MISYCDTIDLPAIPEKFLLSKNQICDLIRLSPDFWWDEGYGSFLADQELHDFIQPFFEKPVAVRYQLITEDRPFHIDACEQTFKYNYVYQTGGDTVKTIWNPDNEFAVTCKQNTWYRLNVKVLHCVKGIVSPRCSITVKEEI